MRAYLLVGLLGLALDQFLKQLLSTQLNTGLALGLQVPNSIVVVLHLILLIGLLYSIYKFKKDKYLSAGLAVIALVSVSNLLDRLRFGGVLDYIQVAGIQFNIADAIIVGTILVLVIREYAKTDSNNTTSN